MHTSHSALTSALGDSGTDPYDYNEYTTAATVFPDHHGASGLAAVASNAYNPAQSQPQGRRVPAVANITQSSIAQNFHHPHSQPVRQQTHQVGDRSYPYYSDTLTANPHATYTRSQDGSVADMSGSLSSNSGNGMPGSNYSRELRAPTPQALPQPILRSPMRRAYHPLMGYRVIQPKGMFNKHIRNTRKGSKRDKEESWGKRQRWNIGGGAGATASGGSAKRRATGGGQAAASGERVSGNYGASSRKRQRGKETDSDSDDEGFAMFRELTLVFSSPSFGC
ncbi:hypothetical protein IMY05_C4420000400 [Salix suchowensis]|nr:hypothetical protein IMY05_C4420000400 [Salix suchowensis]